MKKIKVIGVGKLKERNIEIMVDDEDFDLLNEFKWKAYLTAYTNRISIKTTIKNNSFKYDSWFGAEINYNRKMEVSLSKLMNIMLHGLTTWSNCGTGSLKFLDGNDLNYTKDNLINSYKYITRLSNEQIGERKKMMLKQDVNTAKTINTSIGWGNICKPEYVNQPILKRPEQNKNPNNNGRQYTNNTILYGPMYLIVRNTLNGVVARSCSEESLNSILELILPDTDKESLEQVMLNLNKDRYHFEYCGSNDDSYYICVVKYHSNSNIKNETLQKVAKFADVSHEDSPDDMAKSILDILDWLYITSPEFKEEDKDDK